MNLEDKIRAYLQGEMPLEDRTDFELAMTKDVSLREAVEDARLGMMMGEVAFEEEIMGMIEEEMQEGEHKKGADGRKNNNLVWGLILGIVCFMIGAKGYDWYQERNADTTSIQYAALYEEPAGWKPKRGDIDSLTLAVALLKAGDPDGAIAQIKGFAEPARSYWLSESFSYLAIEEPSFSDSTLIYIESADVEDKVLKDRLKYLKYLSLINLNKLDEAKSYISENIGSMDPYYQKFIE